MRIRSFIIAYALVLAILLFADRRRSPFHRKRTGHPCSTLPHRESFLLSASVFSEDAADMAMSRDSSAPQPFQCVVARTNWRSRRLPELPIGVFGKWIGAFC